MPGRGQDADRRPEPPRVLETVSEGHEPVARAPDEKGWAADAVEVGTGVVSEQGAACAADVGVLRGAFEEAEDRLGIERPPQAEGEPTKPRPAREGAPEPRHHLRRANGCGDGKPDLRAARGR